MTGSPLVPIVVPIVALLCLGAWIALVFYADSHPGWRHSRPGAGGEQPPPAAKLDGQPAQLDAQDTASPASSAPPAAPAPPAPPPARRAA
jgi:hypothetical protein